MKVSRILYLIAIIFSSFPLLAQEEEDIPFAMIEKQPCYLQADLSTGQTKEIPIKNFLDHWVMENFQYPEKALKKKMEGRVLVLLRINKKGFLSIKEFKEGDPIFQEEVRRLFEGFPQLTPALQRGKPIGVNYLYPIVFRL